MISIVVALMLRFLGFHLLYVMFFILLFMYFFSIFSSFYFISYFFNCCKKVCNNNKIIINLATDYKQKKMLSAPTKRAVIL